ncbi:hypothetical protein [Nostoc sp. UHCC 0302]
MNSQYRQKAPRYNISGGLENFAGDRSLSSFFYKPHRQAVAKALLDT